MSATVEQIVDADDRVAILRAMADVYERYGHDAVGERAQPLPAQATPVPES